MRLHFLQGDAIVPNLSNKENNCLLGLLVIDHCEPKQTEYIFKVNFLVLPQTE